jgi:hypothetical protein
MGTTKVWTSGDTGLRGAGRYLRISWPSGVKMPLRTEVFSTDIYA